MPPSTPLQGLRSRLALPLGLLVAACVAGTIGYRVLWNDIGGTWMDAVYMTFITLATIGFQEVKPLDDVGRLFTMAIATTGIGSVGYILTVGLDYLTSESVRLGRRLQRMQERLDKQQQHYIVAGYGLVGREAAGELHRAGVPVVVVANRAPDAQLADQAGLLVLEGDAAEDAVLERAGIRRAKGLIVATGSDATNLYIILTARLLNPDLVIASRAVDGASIPKLVRAGANRAVNPYAIGGRRLAHLMVTPQVVDYFDTAFERGKQALKVAVVNPPPDPPRPLDELVPASVEVTVLVVLRGQEVVTAPDPSFSVRPGDRLLVLGDDNHIAALERAMSQDAPMDAMPA